MTDPDVTLLFTDDLKRLFDLATDSPLVCSGSFENDDVDLLRRLAVLIGVDPDGITPDEFITNYPHAFKSRPPFVALVRTLRVRDDASPFGSGIIYRDETHEEYAARRAESEADACDAGVWGRRCGRPAADPKHEVTT